MEEASKWSNMVQYHLAGYLSILFHPGCNDNNRGYDPIFWSLLRIIEQSSIRTYLGKEGFSCSTIAH
jgi:hypothetical protein